MSELNYTNRIEIPKEVVQIEDLSTPSQNQLIIRSLDIDSFGFPEDAEIWLSVQRFYMYQRYNFGHPSSPQIARAVKLDFSESAGISDVTFRLMVVDSKNKILGASRPFKVPSSGRQVTPLLDMQVRDIGQEVWQLELDEETGPLLLVSSRLADPQSVIDNPLFVTCVLPSLLKQIAIWILSTEIDDVPDSAVGKWMRLFGNLGIDVNYDRGRSFADILVRADDAARIFAAGHELLDTYVKFAEGPQ
jgi:hypothetical protein